MSHLGPVLVADDERLGRLAIRGALEQLPGLPAIEECATGRQTLEAVRTRNPCLLFLDIGLPDLDGIDVLQRLGPDGPPVVMVTASEEHALQAYEGRAVDYVVKPFSDARLLRAARSALRAAAIARVAPLAEQLLLDGDAPPLEAASWAARRFAVRVHRRIRFVPFDDVDYIRADGNYAVLVVGEEEHHLRTSLARLEDHVGDTFRRVHRSTMVNVRRVSEIRTLSSAGDAEIVLDDGRRLRLSRRYRKAWTG